MFTNCCHLTIMIQFVSPCQFIPVFIIIIIIIFLHGLGRLTCFGQVFCHLIRRYPRLCVFAYEYFVFLGRVTKPYAKPPFLEDQFVSLSLAPLLRPVRLGRPYQEHKVSAGIAPTTTTRWRQLVGGSLSLRSILILFYHLCLVLPSGLFPSHFPTKSVCVFLNFITLIFG